MKQFLIICSILLSSTVFGQEELRYENRQFYQGEKEITYNEFYEIIKSPNEFYSSRFQDILFLSQSSHRINEILGLIAFTGIGALTGAFFDISDPSNLDLDDIHYLQAIIGGSLFFVTGELIISQNRKRLRNKNYYPWEKIRFKQIIRRYNKSLISN